MVRYPDLPQSAIISILKKDTGDMLVKEVLEEIKKVDETIKNLTVVVDDVSIEYRNICGIVRRNCFQNPFSVLLSEINDLLTRKKKIKYPVEIDRLTLSYNVYSLNLGGVKTDGHGYVESVKAIRLFYPFDTTTKWKQKWIEQWTKTVYDEIGNSRFQHIKIFINPFWSIKEHAKILFSNLRPMIAAVVIFISAFSMITCMSLKLIRSKPWLGVASVVSAGLAISASFGLMGFFGTKNTYWNICISFLVIVTEIDDAFVLIASWRITDANDNVVNRLRNTYREAAVSITLTSLTNFLAYCVGMTTSFPLITFFGGCMAISGYREEKGLHPITLRSFESEHNSLESNQQEEEFFMKIKNQIGNILSFPITKVIVIILYFANLGLGIYGCFSIRQGIDWQNLFPVDSPISRATNVMYSYFDEYGFTLNIIINETLDYSDITVQQNIELLTKKFESHPHISDGRLTVSWLKYYKEFQEHPVAKYSLAGYNMSTKQDFLGGLRKVFLRFKEADEFSSDIVFNEDESDIICSRLFVTAKDVSGREIEIKFLDDMWKIAEEVPFTVLVHSPVSILIEQGIIIMDIVMQMFWVTSVLILIVFLLFIPNVICAFLVAISVVSTITETLGLMSLWDVNVDVVSMMSLILCVGFCINYPAHISYAFVRSNLKNSNEKLRDSLYHLGYPILQGTLSTTFGILFLYKETYFILVLIKIVFLMTLETAFHAMVFIPVVLSLIPLANRNENFDYVFVRKRTSQNE
ncbi:patched domain-containing protein 3-like [Centruroides sculpturatus]|uniref:patched domain-containing protein 3-like n=1 Tax=Centruroides sculpturatus TaxID=218467 RepID=UPI000C6CDA57|nr:patched domain-containing protein 3-like [Centruroides sculpturatus]